MRKFVANVAFATAFLVVGLLGALPAKASTFVWSYLGSRVSGSGTFTGNFVGGNQFNLTGITGTETDLTGTYNITGLSPYAAADNQLYFPSAQYVTFGGISFTTERRGCMEYLLGSARLLPSQ